jgi:S-adenosylmethionine:tRNA ribosyltransferase-isomerase
MLLPPGLPTIIKELSAGTRFRKVGAASSCVIQRFPQLEAAATVTKPGPANGTKSFHVPAELNADRPPERRGVARDRVRLLVLDRNTGDLTHTRFDRIVDFLDPGDLLVFNSSRTLPATLTGSASGSKSTIEVRLAELLPNGTWLALLLPARKYSNPIGKASMIEFGEGLRCKILEQNRRIPRLWRLRFSKSGADFLDSVYRLGEPVRYSYLSAPWRLSYYQNVYSLQPGAAEMPSAGRAFTWRLLFQLRRIGVETASITLHAGLSSYLDDETDRKHLASEEEYWINEEAAGLIRKARSAGRRIIAVGSTVVRALESVAVRFAGDIRACHQYTRLRITAESHLQVVNGLLTGLHEPEASHLDLLAAFVSPSTIRTAYHEAIEQRYLWHEFGDLNLIL